MEQNDTNNADFNISGVRIPIQIFKIISEYVAGSDLPNYIMALFPKQFYEMCYMPNVLQRTDSLNIYLSDVKNAENAKNTALLQTTPKEATPVYALSTDASFNTTPLIMLQTIPPVSIPRTHLRLFVQYRRALTYAFLKRKRRTAVPIICMNEWAKCFVYEDRSATTNITTFEQGDTDMRNHIRYRNFTQAIPIHRNAETIHSYLSLDYNNLLQGLIRNIYKQLHDDSWVWSNYIRLLPFKYFLMFVMNRFTNIILELSLIYNKIYGNNINTEEILYNRYRCAWAYLQGHPRTTYWNASQLKNILKRANTPQDYMRTIDTKLTFQYFISRDCNQCGKHTRYTPINEGAERKKNKSQSTQIEKLRQIMSTRETIDVELQRKQQIRYMVEHTSKVFCSKDCYTTWVEDSPDWVLCDKCGKMIRVNKVNKFMNDNCCMKCLLYARRHNKRL